MLDTLFLIALFAIATLSLVVGWDWSARRELIKRVAELEAERANEARESSLMAAMLNSADFPIFALNTQEEGRLCLVNDAACRHFGVGRDELLQWTPAAFDTLTGNKEIRSHHERELNEGRSVQFSSEHLLASGRRVFVDMTVSPHTIDGALFGIAAVHDRSVETAVRARIQQLELNAELLDQERRYREILDALSDGVLLLDIAERHLSIAVINPAAAQMFGVKAEAVVGHSAEGVLPPDLIAEISVNRREYSGAGATRLEKLIALPRGRCEMEILLIPLRNRQGSSHRFAVILRDITERRSYESQLLASAELERRLSEFIMSAPGCFFTSAVLGQGRFAMNFCSEGSRDLFGIAPERMCGSPPAFAQLVPEEDRKSFFDIVAKSAEDLTSCHAEFRINHPFKGTRWIEARSQPQRGLDGSVRFNGFMYDITERKEAEALRHERDQEFRALIENSPDTVARYDNNCRGVYANGMQLRAWAVSEAEFLGRTPAEVPGAAAGHLLFSRLEEILATGREDEFEYEWQNPEGHCAWTHVRLAPELDCAGAITGVLVIGRDISPLKAAERVLEESRARLRRLAAHRDSEQERERKRLAHGMHEDLAQILAVLGWELKRVSLSMDTDSPYVAQIAHMSSLADRALRTVLSTVNEIRPATLGLGVVPALERLVHDFEQTNGILCTLDADETDVALGEERATMLYRMVEALLGTVLETPGSEHVEVSLVRHDFKYLLRVDDANPKLKGGGEESLGLIIVQEFALRLAGEAVVVDLPSRGRAVEVIIPAEEMQMEIAYIA